MTGRSGLGSVEVGILEALESMRATPSRGHVKTDQVLAEAEARVGLGRRYLYEVLLDLARPWKVPVQLVHVHGNYGSPSSPASDPSHNDSRLSPVGVVVLAAEHGELGPIPVGLINGSFYSGGLRPPLDADRLLMALRRLIRRPSVTNRELAATVGMPDFLTGCDVDGDLAAMMAGKSASFCLHPRVTVADGHVVIEALPPGVTEKRRSYA
jgi:DNA gyrase/topoisomerase IV subunit A